MIKEKIFKSLNFPIIKTISAKIITIWLIVLSLVYGTIAILESEESLLQQFYVIFILLSCITGFTFNLEYFLRFWTYNQKCKEENSISTRWDYFTSIIGVIDFLSAISFVLYLIGFFVIDVMDFTRFLRLFVLLKFTHYSGSFKIIIVVIKRKKEELLITLMLSLILMFFGAIFIYIAEHDAQPDKITNFFSSMCFTAINLFTIGYGDIVPLTLFGKIVSGIISYIGITLFLLPAGVIVSGFLEELEERKPSSEICPNCQEIISKSEFIMQLRKKKDKKKINNIKNNNKIWLTFDATDSSGMPKVIYIKGKAELEILYQKTFDEFLSYHGAMTRKVFEQLTAGGLEKFTRIFIKPKKILIAGIFGNVIDTISFIV